MVAFVIKPFNRPSARCKKARLSTCKAVLSPSDFRVERKQDVILDVRDSESFSTGHLPGATNIPSNELLARLLEMPPPNGDPLTVVCSDERQRSDVSLLLSGRGWDLASAYIASEVSDGLTNTNPSVASWRPNEFLECVLDAWAAKLPKYGTAVDYGCGSGRDAIFLAQRLPGWRIIGVDNHTNALDRASDLAKREGAKVEFILQDLRKETSIGVNVDLVHGSRFLSRPLLEDCRNSILNPGGLFIWSTFMEGENNPAPPFRPSRRLRPRELPTLFDEEDFRHIHYSERSLITRNERVPACFFACHRKD